MKAPTATPTASKLSQHYCGSTSDFTFAAFILAFIVLPLAVAPGWFLGHDVTPKLVVLAAAVCVCLLSLPEWWPGIVALSRCRAGTLYLAGLGLFGASILVSTLGSVHFGLSLAGTTWRRFGLLTQESILFLEAVCSGYLAHRPDRLRKLLNSLLLTGFALSAYAVCQFLGFDPLFDPALYTYEYIGKVTRPPATLGHAMYLATFLLPLTFIAAVRTFEERRPAKRIILLTASALMTLAIILSGTRSALLGLAFGAVLMALLHGKRINRQAVLGIGSVAVVLTLAVFGIYESSLGEHFRPRVAQWFQDARGGPRPLVWRDSLQLIKEHPFLGHGPETFAEQFRRVESAELANAYPDVYNESPHNYVVDTVVSQGSVGLLAALLLIAIPIYSGFASRISVTISAILAGFLAMLAALQFVPLTPAIGVVFYSLAGMLVASRVPRSDPKLWTWRPTFRLVVGTAMVAVVGAATLYAVQDALFADLGRTLSKHKLLEAGNEYDLLCRLPFPRPGQDLWFSRQLAALAISAPQTESAGVLALALRASTVAERDSEEPFNALYQSAALAVASGDSETAERKLRLLNQKAPTWYKPHLLLAQILILSDRSKSGVEEGSLAANLAGKHRSEVERSIRDLLDAARLQ